MGLTLKKYVSVDNTLENIKRLINRYKSEPKLKVFDSWPLKKIHDYVRSLPYIFDPVKVPIYNNDDIELLKSPYMTIMTNGGDCDDKAILLGCIFERKKIPYRMKVVITEKGRDWHHIYPEIFYTSQVTGAGRWVPFDATYRHNKPFAETKFIKAKIYDWTCGQTVTFVINKNSLASHGAALSCAKVNSSRLVKSNSSFLNGLAGSLGLRGTRLAILEGYNCRDTVMERTAQLTGLGAIPVATLVAAAGAVAKLFSSFFGSRPPYQDAYNAWAAVEQDLRSAHAAWDAEGKPLNSENFNRVVADRAVIAVMSRDYMNPPSNGGFGPEPRGFCTRQGDNYYCGNRAEWSKIKTDVEQKAGEFAPFLKWVNWEAGEMKTLPWNDWSLGGLVQLYDMFKNKSGLYNQFQQVSGKYTKSKTAGKGINAGTVLTLAALSAGAYFVFK